MHMVLSNVDPRSAGMLAMDGRCKTMDSSADGYVRAEACVVFLIETVAQGSGAFGTVIFGSAVNQDGRSSSLTAPNGPAQQGVIRIALQAGEVAPEALDALEMHGTGTPLGDPIEIGAMTAVTKVCVSEQWLRLDDIECLITLITRYCRDGALLLHTRQPSRAWAMLRRALELSACCMPLCSCATARLSPSPTCAI